MENIAWRKFPSLSLFLFFSSFPRRFNECKFSFDERSRLFNVN